jgi:nitronate monooxygenase
VSGDLRSGMLDYGPAAVFAQAIESAETIIDGLIDEARAAIARVQHLQRQPAKDFA